MGAVLGALVGVLMGKSATPTTRVEDVLVGVFGAAAGGELLAAMLQGAQGVEQSFAVKLALAAGTSVVMLLLLVRMRRSVGPIRESKSRKRG